MSSNANPSDNRQVQTNDGQATTQVSTPQASLPSVTLVQASPTVHLDTAIFARSATQGPIQTRDGTPRISLVPIRGAFFDTATATALQSQPVEYLTAIKDRENNALSPLSLSPIPPCSEKTASLTPLPILPQPQTGGLSGASSTSSGVLTSVDPDGDCYSRETLLTLWKRTKALVQYHAEHGRKYPSRFGQPGAA